MATVTDRTLIDARPIRATSANTGWDQAIARRDAIADTLRKTLQSAGLDALVFVSSNGNYPPWVKLEAWLPVTPDHGTTGTECERAELTLIIDVLPYNEHKVVVSADMQRGKKKLAVAKRPAFSSADVAEWLRYTLGRGGKPSNYTPVLDKLQAIAHGMLFFIPEPHQNHVEERLQTRFWQNGAILIGFPSLAALGIGAVSAADSRYGPPPAAVLGMLVGVIGLVVAGFIVSRRKQAVSVISQPVVPPRNLGLVDSWHAVISQIGRDSGSVYARVSASLADLSAVGIESQPEVYGYRTANGFEQRERIVVSKGQCQVHVHMYPFGDDMFIGWQAFLNWAQWAETVPVARKIKDGQEIEFRELRSGPYVPNQFDLMDLNSLTELVHRRIERQIKAVLKEKQIDQQIDFKIIRGDRDQALKQSGSYS